MLPHAYLLLKDAIERKSIGNHFSGLITYNLKQNASLRPPHRIDRRFSKYPIPFPDSRLFRCLYP